MKSIVWITQKSVGKDYTPAMKHGALELIIKTYVQVDCSNVSSVWERIRNRLSSFKAGDALVLTGDPVIMAMAVMVITQKVGSDWKALKWDRHTREYKAIDFMEAQSFMTDEDQEPWGVVV